MDLYRLSAPPRKLSRSKKARSPIKRTVPRFSELKKPSTFKPGCVKIACVMYVVKFTVISSLHCWMIAYTSAPNT